MVNNSDDRVRAQIAPLSFLHRLEISCPRGRLTQHHSLQKIVGVGKIAFIAAGFTIPGGPFSSVGIGSLDAVLEVPLLLSIEHGAQDFVCLLVIAGNVIRKQEVQAMTGGYATVLILLEGV